MIQWIKTQHEESEVIEVEDNTHVTDGWGIMNMRKTEEKFSDAISEADPHIMDAKG